MPYLIGIDEAGYGPNLGPLVIAASVWQVPPRHAEGDLYELLSEAVRPAAREHNAPQADTRIAIADSKQLYKTGSPALLETGLLSCLAQLHAPPARWSECWQLLAGDSGAHRDETPWHRQYDRPLPLAAQPDRIAADGDRLRRVLAGRGIRLAAVRAVAIFPREFNGGCRRLGNKGALLTDRSLALLAELTEPLDEPCRVECDKHGGRNRYAAALQNHFPDSLPAIVREGRAESAYSLGGGPRQIDVRFRVGGERFLPTALASMAAKYLRELAMLAFNDYWRADLPELKPTAGYPLDARRFREQIAPLQEARGIDDTCLWRLR